MYRRVKNAIAIANFLKRESNRKAILRASRAGALVSAKFNASALNRLPLPNLKSRPSVLIIYNPYLRQCVRYRVQQKIEALRRRDIQYEVIPENELTSTSELNGYTHFLFQRPEPNENSIQRMRYAGQCGKVILDVDDAIFSKEALDLNQGLAGLPTQLVKSFYTAIPFYQEMLRQSHVYCASTHPIANLASKYAKEIVLWRNLIDDQHISVAKYYAEQTWNVKLTENVIMTSLSSGIEKDLDESRTLIESVMECNKDLILSLAGPPPNVEWLKDRKDRVRNLPPLNYLPHLFRMARFPATVIPLADHPFNRCKSAIRVQEGFLLAMDVFCSKHPEFIHVKDELQAYESVHFIDEKGDAVELFLDVVRKKKEYNDVRATLKDRIQRIVSSDLYLPNVSEGYVKGVLR
ncbi:hypothetical protein [Chelativorans sp. AA-79]|uniref:hypothetical protein n=1 Tax=Chelativorans sp. AA-79 TaxID=3028735 RepID=UPI0023FA1579|nr:hypothetical protein [Chelativorans sp. AA-79]WEX10238.1 hypothetical protein PVE73_04565 [Chelativorans sp. AA-79]